MPHPNWRLGIEDRFLLHVDKAGPMNPKTGSCCWLWTGHMNGTYGRFHIDGRMQYAHRVAYELFVGPVPSGYDIDHDTEEVGCHNPACVNPGHVLPALPNSNKQRRRGCQANSKSGERGVRWDEKRGHWVGVVGANNKRYAKASKDRAVVSEWVREMRARLHR